MRKQALNECIAKAELFIKRANELQQSDPYTSDYFRLSNAYNDVSFAATDLLRTLIDLRKTE